MRFFYWYYMVSFLAGFSAAQRELHSFHHVVGPWAPDAVMSLPGLGILMGYFHTPYVGDNYDHFPESPLYRWAGISVCCDSGRWIGMWPFLNLIGS